MVLTENKSIVFIGFMGAGKTTVGKLAAKKLGWRFVDIDEEIENEYHMSVTEIFKQKGEKAFREREKSLIAEVCSQKKQVVSLGGGAFLQEEIREVCLSSSIVFFLDVSFEAWKNRLSLILDSRPVLQGKSLEEMKELFYKRQEIYQTYHHYKIETDHRNAGEIADAIVHLVLK